MAKNDSCNLTKREWSFLNSVFDEYYYNAEEPDKVYKKLQNLQMKIFFMDYLVKQELEKEDA